MSALRRLSGDEEGQAILLAAAMFLALLFMVGLAIDGGQLFVAKRTQQEAADAAAFAGAIVLYQGGTNAQASASFCFIPPLNFPARRSEKRYRSNISK